MTGTSSGGVLPVSRPWWMWDLGVTLATLLLLLAWDLAGADLRVEQWFGTAKGFAWHDRWLTAELLHKGGRWVSYAAMLTVVIHLIRPLPFAPTMPRAARGWWLLATLACLLLIPFIKSRSLISCPWDLAEFGGKARYLPHWAVQAWVGAGDGGPGRCFPSGHASGAFSFITGWFVLRGPWPRAAHRWLVAVCAVGLVFGVAQMARGAHYPSHVGWTAWICWALSAALWFAAGPWLNSADAGSRSLSPTDARSDGDPGAKANTGH